MTALFQLEQQGDGVVEVRGAVAWLLHLVQQKIPELGLMGLQVRGAGIGKVSVPYRISLEGGLRTECAGNIRPGLPRLKPYSA